MNSFMIAFGLASIALCIGVFLRARIPFLRNMLVPSSVIAGIIGVIFIWRRGIIISTRYQGRN